MKMTTPLKCACFLLSIIWFYVMIPPVNAQWMDRSPHAYHTTSPLEHAAFYSEDVFTAVGEHSTVLWVFQDVDGLQQAVFNKVSDLNYRLTGVHMVSETEALIVSHQGVLFHTVNRGLDWEQFELSGSPLRGIYFFDEENGFIYGNDGLLLRTNNGGIDWDEIQSGTGNNWNSALVVNENFAALVGEAGTIARTDNAGADWQFDVIDPDHTLMDLAIHNDVIYLLEDGRVVDNMELSHTIYSSAIGLENAFETAHILTHNEVFLTQIVAVSDTHFVFINNNLISLCSGIHEIITASRHEFNLIPDPDSFIQVDTDPGTYIPFPSDENSFLIVGSRGYLGRYTTGSHSAIAYVVRDYSGMISKNHLHFTGAAYTAENRLYVTAYLEDHCDTGREDYILSKNPGDLFWQVDKIFSFNPPQLGAISFNEAGFGFIFTQDGSIEITEDFGQNWSTESPGISALINDAVWLDNETLFAVGDDGSILFYENEEFSSVDGGGGINLHGIVRLDANTALAVGSQGTALLLERGGPISTLDTGIGDDLHSVAKTGDVIVATGQNGRVIRSADQGGIWDVIPIGTNANFYSVAFIGSGIGYIVGAEGTVYKTEDGGLMWGEQMVPTSEDLNTVIIVDEHSTYIAGLNGTMMYTKSGGQYTSINQNDPKEWPSQVTLLQNYPNPFNPSTTIRFKLSQDGDISLEVFDVLGRRVAILYKGAKPAGYHTIGFNAYNLSSGVYFVILQSYNQVVTLPMLLQK